MKRNITYPAIVGTSAIEMCGGPSAFDMNIIAVDDYRRRSGSSRTSHPSRYTMRQALHDSRELSAQTESGIAASSLLIGTIIGCTMIGAFVIGLLLLI